MGTRVTWSRNARLEVEKIRTHIERDSKYNAVQVVGSILAAAKRLTVYPLAGPMIAQWNNPEHRELIVGSYRVMYRVLRNEITIFSVRHTRRRVPKRFRNTWLE